LPVVRRVTADPEVGRLDPRHEPVGALDLRQIQVFLREMAVGQFADDVAHVAQRNLRGKADEVALQPADQVEGACSCFRLGDDLIDELRRIAERGEIDAAAMEAAEDLAAHRRGLVGRGELIGQEDEAAAAAAAPGPRAARAEQPDGGTACGCHPQPEHPTPRDQATPARGRATAHATPPILNRASRDNRQRWRREQSFPSLCSC